MEDLLANPPTEIDPYTVLEINATATSSEVKSAYKSMALRHHPDKVHPEAKNKANVKFQEITFAYAILSDERRRKRYDLTGNTSESLDLGDDDFDWSDFFRAQWTDHVTGETLNSYRETYQTSAEEREDVLAAYVSAKGDLDRVFKGVILSNALDDEERFRGYIDQGIKDGEVEAFPAYTRESKMKTARRRKIAAKEDVEAREHAKKIGVYDQLFGDQDKGSTQKGKENKKEGGDQLAQLIQQRQKARAGNFLEDLEAKYAPKKGGTKRKNDEPPEEMFQRNRVTGAGRHKKKRMSPSSLSVRDEDKEEIDAEATSLPDDDEVTEDTEEKDEQPKAAKSKSKGKRSRGRKGRKKASR